MKKQLNKKEKLKNKSDIFRNMKDSFKNIFAELKKTAIAKLKSLTAWNYVNIVLLLFILVTSHYVFFQYKVVPFADGQTYYRLSLIIKGSQPLRTWQLVRGFSFPLIISGITTLFGDSQHGLVTGFYMFYLFSILSIGYFLQKYLRQCNSKKRISFIILYLLLVVFNPLIIGWSHTLLVEAVIPTIYMVVVMLLYKWYRINYSENKKKEIIFGISLAILGTFTWFLKQPYAPAFYAGLVLASILSAVYFKSKKILYQKLLTCLCCLIFMIVSIFTWNGFIKANTSKSANDITSDYMSSRMVCSLNVYYYVAQNYCNNEYINGLSKSDRREIKKIQDRYGDKWCKHLYIYEIREKNNSLVDVEILSYSGKGPTIFENFKFLAKNMVKHPRYVFGSYMHNYLAIVDLEDVDLMNSLSASTRFNPNVVGENLSNGLYPLYPYNQTIPEPISVVKHLQDTTTTNETLTNLLLINNSICFYLFKILLLTCFPIFIYTLVKFIKTKETIYSITSIISFMCFINIAFNVFMGAIIDRYVYAFYPLMILTMLLLFIDNTKVRSDVNEKRKK